MTIRLSPRLDLDSELASSSSLRKIIYRSLIIQLINVVIRTIARACVCTRFTIGQTKDVRYIFCGVARA